MSSYPPKHFRLPVEYYQGDYSTIFERRSITKRLKNITNICDEVYKSVLLRQTNIAFVGMPYSGKSYKGKRLASEMGIPYVDSDAILHEKKMSLEQMLKENKTIK